jgi:hypothetical protein
LPVVSYPFLRFSGACRLDAVALGVRRRPAVTPAARRSIMMEHALPSLDDIVTGQPIGRGASSGGRAVPAGVERTSVEQEKLALRIERQVRSQTNDKVRELRVEVRRSGVTLFGRCGTFYCKQVAQQTAMALIEGRPLVNQIEVW